MAEANEEAAGGLRGSNTDTDPSLVMVTVSVRLPSDEFIELVVVSNILVSELLTSLVAHKIGLKETHITLTYRKKAMDPHHTLHSFNVDNNSCVSVEAIINSEDTLDLRYDDFLDSVELSTTQQNFTKVSVDAYFTFR